VSLRIIVDETATKNVVRVCGRLVGEAALGELIRVCESLDGALVIDLSDLRHADEAALSALRGLRAQGTEMIGASPYLSLLLASPST